MNVFLIALSLVIVAFGQPASLRGCGVLAAAFGFALFWKAMLTVKESRRFWLALIWFASVQGIQLSWMATLDYMGPLILLVYLLLILGMGAQFGFLSRFLTWPDSWRRNLAMAGSWVIFEWSRLFILCGFTWNPVGLALTDSPYSLQFASIWGIFGLSFWVILVNLKALRALLDRSSRSIAIWAALALFPYLFGWVHQTWIEARFPASKNLSVALVQTAIFPEQRDRTIDAPDDYLPPLVQWERILGVLDPKKKVDLIVLPEGALPFGAHEARYDLFSIHHYFNPNYFPPLRRPYAVLHNGMWKVSNAFLLQTLANQSGAHVIVGMDDVDFNRRYNAAFHFCPHNIPSERYEKRVLVPVGEYIPLEGWKLLTDYFADQFGIYGSFNPGSDVKIFNAHFPIGISMCIEETFSSLTRELRVNGAEVFVNLTNDVWFPGSKLPRQHFDHGRVRAAENGVPIVRACTTGITGVVDCFGKPLAELPISEEKASSLYFSFPVRSYPTLYTWWGDEAILAISLCAIVLSVFFRKKKLP